ncbi:obscurin-like protein 1a isoform X3 [Stegostoma tigrinum]|uniref:obscurin-like protein 1a isoform X3 n=1 Tax=Stegostoma tigrinum TaxID=3053191 RepID=UPI002870AF7A|nr:obscurin-like protein 1a isoform X3 [Stegostoma tigrinum]
MDVFGGAPRFLSYPRTFTVPNGADAVLKCQIIGDPRPTVIWERDKTQISPRGRYRFLEDGNVYNLVVSRARMEDSGQYICKAKNGVGETYAAATLKVEEGDGNPENRPAFVVKPTSARVVRGHDVIFTGRLAGSPMPAVTWEKDGKKLSEIFENGHFSEGCDGEGWHHLKVFNARMPDAGVYLCKARNLYGEAMSAAVLLVDPGDAPNEPVPPTTASNGLGVSEGSGVQRIRREARRGKRHRLAHREPQSVSGVARQSQGSGEPPTACKVKVFSVTEGKHAKFRCYVTGKPKPEIFWRKDGRLIVSGRRHLLYEDREGYFILKVLYCKQQDNGLYACAASNAAGQTLSSVLLNVKEPRIKFKSQLQDVEVNEREQAILECEVPGDSIPAVWYLEDRKLHSSAKYIIEQQGAVHRLTIKDVTMDDDGVYLCEMKNGGRSIAEVAVKGKIVKRLPRKLDVLEGENAAFCVDLDEENVEVSWYKDGELLTESHKTIIKSFGKTHILVFVNVTAEDSSVITFVISDSKSSSQLRVKRRRHVPPSTPENVWMSCEKPNVASLLWAPPSDCQRSEVMGYVIERQEQGTEEWVRCLTTEDSTTVEILGESVPNEARYRFRVSTINNYGRSEQVEFPGVVHLVPSAKIQIHLSDMTVYQNSDAEFTIELSTSVLGTWHMKGQQLHNDQRFKIDQSRTRHSLLIRGVNVEENESEITFVAHGVRDSAILFVKAVPVKITLGPGMETVQQITASESIVLCCEVSRPSVEVHWCKDGEILTPSDRVSVHSSGHVRKLIVQSACSSDSGQYICSAAEDVLIFTVNVLESPVRIVNTTDDTKMEYHTSECIVLTCELSRSNAEVKWYKNGLEVEGSGRVKMESHGLHRSLIIKKAGMEDSGEYVCDAGDDSIFYDITVREPPVKIVNSSSPVLNVLTGDEVVLSCELSRPEAEVRWYKDGVEVDRSERSMFEVDGRHRRLTICQAAMGDQGTYVCDAVDSSAKFEVAVSDPPVRIVDSSFPMLSVLTGDEVVLMCELSRPEAEVQWHKDGMEVEHSERLMTEVDGRCRRLTIHPAAVGDRGIYVCDAVDVSAKFEVTVSEPPVRIVNSSSPELSVLTGDEIVLSCELSRPEAKVRWYKDGAEVEWTKRSTVEVDRSHRRLTIRPATVGDRGTYLCDAADDSARFEVAVSEPPVRIINSSSAELNVLTGDEIVLWCELSRPKANVRWYKDGVEVERTMRSTMEVDGVHRRLTVRPVTMGDRGTYLCDAFDDSAKFEVAVSEPPIRIVNSSSPVLSILTGDKVVLSCELSQPRADVRWYKDGVEVERSERSTVEVDGEHRRLTIRQARSGDCGTYLCDAVDDSAKFKVNVSEPPVKIIRQIEGPREHKYLTSEDVTLQCELTRLEGVAKWYKDGEKVVENKRISIGSEGTFRSLRILDAQITDSGEYLCDVQSDSIVFTVCVEVPPVEIIRQTGRPANHKYLTSEDIMLQCELSRPDGVATWYKDGQMVLENEKIFIRREGTLRSLCILDARTIDSGEYLCDVQNDSIGFRVHVEEPPVKIIRQIEGPREHKYLTSEDATLHCELTRLDGVAKWYKDGEKVVENKRISIGSEGTFRSLQILDAQIADSGEYLCDVQSDSIVFTVCVEEPPVKIVRQTGGPADHKYLTSEDIMLQCELSRPDGVAKWYKDGEMMLENKRISISREGTLWSLHILDAQMTDSGEYLCDVQNDSIVFQVHVEDPPVMIVGSSQILEDRSFIESETIAMTCKLSRPDVQVYWYRDGMELQPSDKIRIESRGLTRELMIFDSEPSDSGQYVCDAGSDKLTFKVTVTEAPVLFTNKEKHPEEVYANENGQAVLAAIVSKDPANVTWYRHKEQVTKGEKYEMKTESRVHSLIIKNVLKEDTGFYICRSTDDEMIFNVNMTELPLRFVLKLEDMCVQRYGSITLWCELNKVKGDVMWLKDGKEVQPSRKYIIRAEGRLRSLTLCKATLDDQGEYSCESKDDKTVARVSVRVPRVVEFISDLRSITVQEGDDANFKCMVSPEDVRLSWRVHGSEIPPGSTKYVTSRNGLCHMLLIRDCQLTDTSQVIAEAEGIVSSANLQVQETQVVFTRKLVSATTEERQDATFEVEVSNELAEVQWMKQGVVIQHSPKFMLQQDGRTRRLIVCDTVFSDRGNYRCETLHDRTQAKLSVEPRRISVKKPLEDMEIFEKEAVTLQVELSHPDVDGVWIKDGIRVKPNNNRRISCTGRVHSLTLSALTLEDSGTVIFQADNVRSTSRITVREPPVTFLKELKDLRVPEATVITLECELSRPNVEVTWYKDDLEMKPNKNIRIYSMGRKRIAYLGKCGIQDSGTYSCDTGECKTLGKLEVFEQEIQIVKELENQDVRENDNAVFVCEVSHAEVKSEWFQNGNRIKSNSSVKIRQEGTKHFLLICKVRVEDAGEIRFRAKNAESVARLDVNELPVKIVKPLRDKTALEKHKVILECKVSKPHAHVRWYRGDEELCATSKYEICSEDCYRQLVIHDVSFKDEDTYTCDAFDDCSSAKLLVEGQAILIVKDLMDVEVTAPDAIQLECELSVPMIRAPQWSLNGQLLQNGDGVHMENRGTIQRLILSNTSPDMSGMVKFTAGKANCSAKLTVKGE